MSYVVDLGLTLVVELPVIVGIAHACGAGWRRSAAVALAANLLTHPVLWFVAAPWLHDQLGIGGLLLAEGAVVLVEAFVYARWLRPRLGTWLVVWLALLANALSVALGIVVH